MDSGKVPVKLVKVTRVLGRTGTLVLPPPTRASFPASFFGPGSQEAD